MRNIPNSPSSDLILGVLSSFGMVKTELLSRLTSHTHQINEQYITDKQEALLRSGRSAPLAPGSAWISGLLCPDLSESSSFSHSGISAAGCLHSRWLPLRATFRRKRFLKGYSADSKQNCFHSESHLTDLKISYCSRGFFRLKNSWNTECEVGIHPGS